jgi:predicted nucleic acid-binding protein
MRLADAMAGVTRLGLDTAPLIYLVEQDPVRTPLLRDIIRRMDAGEFVGYASVILLTEAITLPRRQGDRDLERLYQDVLTTSANFTIVPVTHVTADLAATLRAYHHLTTPDALVAATAIQVGCQALLTNDRGMQRVTGIRVLILDDLSA